MSSRAELVLRADALGLDPDNYPNDSKLEQKVLYLEKNASTMAGTLATGTLTAGGDLTTLDQVKIGDITYTFVTALSEAKASSTLTSDATNVDDGDTVTIDGIQYTFRTTPVHSYEVDIGGSAAASLDNLKSAINDSGTEGTTYGTGTAAHPTVTAEANADTTQEVTAKDFGTYANEYITLESSDHLAWDDSTLGGSSATPGVNPVQYEVLLGANAAASLDNLKLAVNYTVPATNEGSKYSTGTRAHPQVTAGDNTDTTQDVTAIDMAVGEDISTTDPTDDGSVLSWGASTLASGVADQNAVDATAKAQTSGDANV